MEVVSRPLNANVFPINNDFQFQKYSFDFTPFDTGVRKDFVINCLDANNFPIVQRDALNFY